MALSEQVKANIEATLDKSEVVLFMKGNKHFPQCGFSSRVIKILNETGAKYETVNVLADPEIRDGIKEFSDWPTIPQLFVRKEFVGGCDIVTELHASGELQKLLGLPDIVVPVPAITVSAEAAKMILAAQEGDDRLRLEISPDFKYDLYFGPPEPGDLVATAEGVSVYFDKASAKRANGLRVAYVEGPTGGAFKIDNPNEPPRVKPLLPKELQALRAAGEALTVVDVRGEDERALAKLAFALPINAETEGTLAALPKDSKLVFQCHHGMRSRAAAERALKQGFRNVFNLEGGIDAWSLDVDPTVARY